MVLKRVRLALLAMATTGLAVFVLTAGYTIVGGFVLGMNVSSLDDGPHWPFWAVFPGLASFVGSAVLAGVAGTLERSRRPRRGRGR